MGINISNTPLQLLPDIASQLMTGQYYPFRNVRANANTAVVADTLYASPLLIPRNITVDRIAIDVQAAGAAGKLARLGIYYDGTNKYPGTLLLDAGTVAVDATGVKTITISQALPAGLYWGVMVSNGTPTVRAHNVATFAPLGLTATDFSADRAMWSVSFTYAALPTPFTASGSAANTTMFNVALRILTLD